MVVRILEYVQAQPAHPHTGLCVPHPPSPMQEGVHGAEQENDGNGQGDSPCHPPDMVFHGYGCQGDARRRSAAPRRGIATSSKANALGSGTGAGGGDE